MSVFDKATSNGLSYAISVAGELFTVNSVQVKGIIKDDEMTVQAFPHGDNEQVLTEIVFAANGLKVIKGDVIKRSRDKAEFVIVSTDSDIGAFTVKCKKRVKANG